MVAITPGWVTGNRLAGQWYSHHVLKSDVLAFVSRDWRAIAESKRRRWSQERAQMDAAHALRVGDELRHHVHAIQTGWPTVAERQDDVACHVRVSEMLSRVKPPLGR
jgi:hypothetical protein